jgi:DNA transformation protein and related proteins
MRRDRIGDQLGDLPGLGPASAAMLREAGIETVAELRALGAPAAYARIRFAAQRGATLNLLWGLHAALAGMDWRSIDAETKARLRREAGML